MAKQNLCCESSRAVGEAMWATAPVARFWICVEWSGAWSDRALEAADLPDSVRHMLLELNAHPEVRVQLISRPDRGRRSEHCVFVARVDRGSLLQYAVADYDELPDLGLHSFTHEPVPWSESTGRDLFMVCTNGRRDRCCALRGNPAFAAADAALGPAAWQTTHLGGHRFAATAVSLPAGRVYGRLEPSDVAQELAAEDVGDIWLDRFRGHSALSQPAQAAEYYLRRAGVPGPYAGGSNHGWPSPATTRGRSGRASRADWSAGGLSADAGRTFAFDTGDGRRAVTVSASMSDFRVYKSSGDAEAVPVRQYALVSIE